MKQDTTKQKLVSQFYMYAILQWDTGLSAWTPAWSQLILVSKYFFPPNIVKYVIIKHPDQDISCYTSEFALFLFLWELSISAPFSLFLILFFVCLSAQSILLFLYWILIIIWEFALGTYGKVYLGANSVYQFYGNHSQSVSSFSMGRLLVLSQRDILCDEEILKFIIFYLLHPFIFILHGFLSLKYSLKFYPIVVFIVI